jgi:hypothetical protein
MAMAGWRRRQDEATTRQGGNGGGSDGMAAPAAGVAGMRTHALLGITSVLLTAPTDSRFVSRSNSRMALASRFLETEGVMEEEVEEEEEGSVVRRQEYEPSWPRQTLGSLNFALQHHRTRDSSPVQTQGLPLPLGP